MEAILVKFIVIIKQVKTIKSKNKKGKREHIYTYPTVVDNRSTDAWEVREKGRGAGGG